MSKEAEKKVNMEPEAGETQGLDQNKFADLFGSLDKEAILAMMERAGLAAGDVDTVLDEEPVESADTELTEEAASGESAVEPSVAEETISAEAAEEAAGGEASVSIISDEESGLSPEHIGHLLSVLGDDIIGDMLESAGLTDEDVNAALAEAQTEIEQDKAAAGTAAAPSAVTPAYRRPRRKGRNIRRLLFVLIFVGIILLVFAVNKIYNSVTINSNDPIQYSEHVDDISADEGFLHVNNVSIAVPTDGTETYSISYSWAEDDDQYPSVPHAITAIYSKQAEESGEAEAEGEAAEKDSSAEEKKAADKEASAEEKTVTDKEAAAGEKADSEKETAAEENADAEEEASEEKTESEKIYSISLYRNETTTSKDVKKGKKASNWFDDWTVVKEGDVLQTPLKSGSINGFYIYPQPPEEDGAVSDYNDFSYYFAVEDDKGISTYVIEGVCLDPERDAEFRAIMDKCINSISVQQ